MALFLLAACGANACEPGVRPRADARTAPGIATAAAPTPRPAKSAATGALTLSLRDQHDGAPFALSIQLWRLGAPEDADWYAGDFMQGSYEVPETGLRIADLPHGRYRVYSCRLRFGSEDPPEFQVLGAETVVALALPTCRQRRVHLKIHDEAGRPIESARRLDGGCGSWTRSGTRFPQWRVERKGKRPQRRGPSGSVRGCGRGDDEDRAVVAGPLGFDLGEHRDNARSTESVSWHHFESRSRSPVWLKLKCDVPRDRTYCGIAYPTEMIERSVFLPNGTLAAESHGVSVVSGTVLNQEDPVPIRVRVHGFQEVNLLCHIGELFPIVRLQRKAE